MFQSRPKTLDFTVEKVAVDWDVRPHEQPSVFTDVSTAGVRPIAIVALSNTEVHDKLRPMWRSIALQKSRPPDVRSGVIRVVLAACLQLPVHLLERT